MSQYQNKYNQLLKKTGKFERSRYGHTGEEVIDAQLKVLESMIVEIKSEIEELKKTK